MAGLYIQTIVQSITILSNIAVITSQINQSQSSYSFILFRPTYDRQLSSIDGRQTSNYRVSLRLRMHSH